MKIRHDFVTNSSSTSYVIINRGDFDFPSFVKAVGINEDSHFIDIYRSLFDSFSQNMEPARDYYRRLYSGKYGTFEEFIIEHLWKDGKEILPKILSAESKGLSVYIGELSSDTNDIECFFCTQDFVIESDHLYINAREDAW